MARDEKKNADAGRKPNGLGHDFGNGMIDVQRWLCGAATMYLFLIRESSVCVATMG